MKNNAFLRYTAAVLGLLLLILDGKTAQLAMQSGIEICLYTLIPSLFPFMVLCRLIVGNSAGNTGPVLSAAGHFCKIPPGCEVLLVTGILGGYPVGAQSVSDLYVQGRIRREDARRMVVFCNNAGPSFLFGILGPLFSDMQTVLLLWAVQITSMLLTGYILPESKQEPFPVEQYPSVTLSQALQSSIRGMVSVCGWVLLFRLFLEYLRKWILHPLPVPVQVFITGLLELSNGCIALTQAGSEPLRFLLASVMLSFGGLCICLQTASVCSREILGSYIPGKAFQSGVSAILSLAAIAASRVVPTALTAVIMPSIPLILGFLSINRRTGKKEVAFCQRMLYNKQHS